MNAHNEALFLLSSTVDQLAMIKAQIAELTALEKGLKQVLTDSGMGLIEGTQHQAAISYCEGRVSIDWQTIAKRFNPSVQLITAHTTQGEAYSVVRVSARKG